MQERIRVDNISKKYGGRTALSDVSIAACDGECLGIYGRSGSGKTALLRVMAGIDSPDSGSITPHRAGFSFQMPIFDETLTPAEALYICATLYGIPPGKRNSAVRDTLILVGMDSMDDLRISALSLGYRKLLEVARALITPFDLLLLDDPMAGLDTDMRVRLWEHLLKLRAHGGKTIILATSRSEDAEICDRVVLLHEGRVLADGTVDQLQSMAASEAVVITPIAAKGGQQSKSERTVIVGKEQDGHLIVQAGDKLLPADVLRQLQGNAAVRLHTRGLDSILDELIAAEKDSGDA